MSGGSIITPREQWRRIRQDSAIEVDQSIPMNESQNETGIKPTHDVLRSQLSLQAAYIKSLQSTIADYQKNQIEMTSLIKKKRQEISTLKEKLKGLDDYSMWKKKGQDGYDKGLRDGIAQVHGLFSDEYNLLCNNRFCENLTMSGTLSLGLL